MVVSCIVIFCIAVVTFPFASVAVHITSVVPIGKASGALFLISTGNISVASAFPMSTGVLIAVASVVISSGLISNGLVVSTMFTFCIAVVTFPFASVAVHSTSVVPIGKTSGALFLISTGNMSVAVASPISTGVSTAVASVVISSGFISNGFVVSSIVTFCTAVVSFPFASVAVHFTSVVPIGKASGALFLISTGKMSVAVASPISTGVFTAVASVVISSGFISNGFVVSSIVTFCTAVVSFPFASVAVHITSVVPIGKVSGALFLISTGNMSIASASPISTGVIMSVASFVISPGILSSGGVESTILILCVLVVVFPFVSVAVQVTTVVPRG